MGTEQSPNGGWVKPGRAFSPRSVARSTCRHIERDAAARIGEARRRLSSPGRPAQAPGGQLRLTSRSPRPIRQATGRRPLLPPTLPAITKLAIGHWLAGPTAVGVGQG